ncbi:hypothetical protein [Alloalcanivorax marinus]|uniref:hypothetical protein n=1 Tax=Alloalcanivorax marinus TaxID=1177169 RepID=UPI001932D14D|nr:hypothetical protein [Alloalcanivorax marinus]MBL7249130.1 hypothetical protein [Alloalcanivorax marinus]
MFPDTLHGLAVGGVSSGSLDPAFDNMEFGKAAAIQGGSFQDHLIGNLESQGNNVLSALAFNQAGSLADSWMTADAGAGDAFGVNFWWEGGLGPTGLHAVAGGTVTQITDGNFGAGAMAAGGNQLAAGFLTDTVGAAYDPVTEQGQYNNWRTAASQLVGLVAAAAANDDVNQGAWIAKQADTYNRQLHPDEIAFAMDDERVAKFQEAHGLTEEQARIELMRSGAAAMDEGWAQVLAGDETNTARAREFLASELQQAGRTDLFQVSASEYADHRLNLKETFGDDESYKSILDYLALPNEVTREEMWAASGKGSGDALREMVTPSLDGIRDRAEMGLDLVFNDGRQTWGSVKSGLEDLTYKGVETRLKIIQGDLVGAEYDFGADTSGVGVGLGLSGSGYGFLGKRLSDTQKIYYPSNVKIGYHATHPDVVPLIKENGFRSGLAPGCLGSGGTYVNDTMEGAISEFQYHNPGGSPEILKVEYDAGVNAFTNVPPKGYVENFPFYDVDSVSAPSVRLPDTINTSVLNGSLRVIE